MSEKMNLDAAPKIVSSLVKALQVVCHGYVEFETNIEIVGHIHINVDRGQKYNYVLNECVNRGDGRSSTFISNSFYAKPPKDGAMERDRPAEPPIESDIMAFAASPYSEPETSGRNVFNSSTSVNHTQPASRLNKRDAQGNTIRPKTGATASSTVPQSVPRVPPLHPAPRDSSFDAVPSDSAKRLRKSSSTDRLDETRRPAPSHRRAGSEERSHSDFSDTAAPSTSASVSSQQPSHTATSASLSAAEADNDANRPRAQDLKEEEEEVVLIKEEVCEEELLRACGGPVFPGNNFSQSHPPTTTSSRGDSAATETISRGQAHHSSDLPGSSYLGSGADYGGPSTSYGDPHDTGQSHLYPVSLHPNMMNTMPGTGGMSMMSPESATAPSTSTTTHPAFRPTDALPGRPGNSSSDPRRAGANGFDTEAALNQDSAVPSGSQVIDAFKSFMDTYLNPAWNATAAAAAVAASTSHSTSQTSASDTSPTFSQRMSEGNVPPELHSSQAGFGSGKFWRSGAPLAGRSGSGFFRHPSLMRFQQLGPGRIVPSVHYRRMVDGESELRFTCRYCGAEFSTRQSYHVHVRGMHQMRQWKCDDCGQMFRWPASLWRHKQKCQAGQGGPAEGAGPSRGEAPTAPGLPQVESARASSENVPSSAEPAKPIKEEKVDEPDNT